MSTKRKRSMDASNLIMPATTAAQLPAGAPQVDPAARERFIASIGRVPKAKPPKMADRLERQLLVYLSRPELRIAVNVRAAQEDVNVSKWVERLIVAELSKPPRGPGQP
jgi:hypothetical protein